MSLEAYKQRVLKNGETSKERILHDMRDAYDHYLSISPEATDVYIDGFPYRYLIQDRRFADEELTGKYMITPYDVQYDIGQYVKLFGEYWFVDLVETENIQRSNAHRLLDCNEVLKWQDDEGRIYEFPCRALDKTSVYSDGLSRSTLLTRSVYQLQVTVPSNKYTEQIDTHDRFIFAHSKFHIYNVTRIDKITRKGLLIIVMKRDEVTYEYDDLEHNLSRPIGINASLNKNIINPDQGGKIKYEKLEIIGQDKITLWDNEMEYYVPNAEVVEWSYDEDYVIPRQEGGILYLAPKKLGRFELKAKVGDTELSKDIQVVFAR